MQESKKSGGQIYGIIAIIFLIISTSLCFIPILFIGLLKLIPHTGWQTWCTKVIDAIATEWCDLNSLYIKKTQKIHWDISGLDTLKRKDWYLVIANHQSWLDIVILQFVLNKKIPVLKFFIKDQLKWVPLLGFCWWAMGMPFMKRYSKDYLAKNPHKKGQDLVSTRKAIKQLKRSPTAITSFIEGTRFTDEKKDLQNSPYTHLLKPKAGGISFIISAMGHQIHSLIDVTIVYPEHSSMWDFLCRRMDTIKVNLRRIPIPAEFTSSKLVEDKDLQDTFKVWINALWADKDQLITSLK